MLTHEEISKLSRLERLGSPIISFYLNLSPEVTWKKIMGVVLKDLLKEGREQIGRLAIGKEDREFLAKDLKAIEDYLKDFVRNREQGLALFSQNKNERFFAYPLYHPLPNQIVVENDICLSPLVNLMRQHRRYCVVTVNQKRARLFEFFLGHLQDRMEIADAIPKKVMAAGYKGYEGKRMDRHAQEGVHHHLKLVADRTFEFFKKYRFDELVIGGEKQVLPVFESVLHSYLKEKLVGRFQLSSDADIPAIEEAARTIEIEHQAKRDLELVHQLEIATNKQGTAVTGLDGTLEALFRGNAYRLIVRENFTAPGYHCSACSVLRADGSICPLCARPLVPVRDIINQAVEIALHQKTDVWHISSQIPFPDGIGAFLRFRVGTTELAAGDVKEHKQVAPRMG